MPFRGTGWMAPTEGKFAVPPAYGTAPPPGDVQLSTGVGGAAPPEYMNQPPTYPAQPQNPQSTGATFDSSQGYYGQNNYAAPQPPQDTYQRGGADAFYEPPPGPPPGKH